MFVLLSSQRKNQDKSTGCNKDRNAMNERVLLFNSVVKACSYKGSCDRPGSKHDAAAGELWGTYLSGYPCCDCGQGFHHLLRNEEDSLIANLFVSPSFDTPYSLSYIACTLSCLSFFVSFYQRSKTTSYASAFTCEATAPDLRSPSSRPLLYLHQPRAKCLSARTA